MISSVSKDKSAGFMDSDEYLRIKLVRIIYEKDISPKHKRNLIKLSYDKKILPTLYKNISQFRNYLNGMDDQNLILMMMKEET